MKIIWSFFILSVSLFFSGCMLTTSAQSITEAKLRRIVKIVESCSLPAETEHRAHRCLEAYAIEKAIPIESLTMDAYEGRIVLHSDVCTSQQKHPYSAGKNGLDECGRGDDITLSFW